MQALNDNVAVVDHESEQRRSTRTIRRVKTDEGSVCRFGVHRRPLPRPRLSEMKRQGEESPSFFFSPLAVVLLVLCDFLSSVPKLHGCPSQSRGLILALV